MSDLNELRQKELELAHAYEGVFGKEGKRTPLQKKVWDDLETRCYFKRSMLALDKEGRVDDSQLAAKEGCRQVFLRIIHNLELAETGLKQTTEAQVKK